MAKYKFQIWHAVAIICIVIITYNLGFRQPATTIQQQSEADNQAAIDNNNQNENSGSTNTSFAITTANFGSGSLTYETNGSVSIYETPSGPIAKFSEDFSTSFGPDLLIYGIYNPEFPETGDLGEFVSLGSVKKNKGSQTYNLPSNYQDLSAISVWCRAFGVNFGHAILEF